MTAKTNQLLFSYGTLQKTALQIKVFGRKLSGFKDKLPRYQLSMVKINSDAVVKLSGETHHPIAIPSTNKGDEIAGTAFMVTKKELASADKYEVGDYQRVMGKLKSGADAWIYVAT